MINETTNKTTKIKNTILAISTETTAIPVKPRTAAITAMIRNVMTQLSI